MNKKIYTDLVPMDDVPFQTTPIEIAENIDTATVVYTATTMDTNPIYNQIFWDIAKLYVATFNRAPDAAGLDYWVNSGMPLEDIAQSFFDQPETQALYPVGTQTSTFITSVYQNVFNRVPDQEGLDYWTHELETHNISNHDLILAVINGAMVSDATILYNKYTVGIAFYNAGLNDITLARDVMEHIDDTHGSVTNAENIITQNTPLDTSFTYSFITTGGAYGVDYTKFNLNATTGAITFKTSPDYEAPSDSGADNSYFLPIIATDLTGQQFYQNISLTVTDVAEEGDSIIDLGEYGKLIFPVEVDGKTFYIWDMNGDATQNYQQNSNGMYDYDGSVANPSGSGYMYDYVTHDFLDTLFNHDINGNINTTDSTNNDYRYATLNGVQVALPTIGTELASGIYDDYYLQDDQTYTDFAEIWDTYNTGHYTSGMPTGWSSSYWSATPEWYGWYHDVNLLVGSIDYTSSDNIRYVALEVL